MTTDRLIEHPAKLNNYIRENHPEWISELGKAGKLVSLKSPEEGPNPPFTVSIQGGDVDDIAKLDVVISAYRFYYNYRY